MPKSILYCCLLVLSLSLSAYSQEYLRTDEFCFVAGPVSFRSDYGERNDNVTNFGNTGFGIGFKYYMHFAQLNYGVYNDQSYFKQHLKYGAELSYNKSTLQNYGRWVDANHNSLEAQQLKAMKGSTEVIDLGINAQYYPFEISDFGASFGSNIAPYIEFGVHLCEYFPKASSSLGPINTLDVTPAKYLGKIEPKKGITLSLVWDFGVRYKLSERSDVLADLRFQYYNTDWVDGVRPNPATHPENKANDWLVWFNVGYVYSLK